MKHWAWMPLAGCLVMASVPALAGDFDWLDLKGSLGTAGGHKRYVPPLSNPLFNETPYVTTELRAIYLHQDIPNSFLTGGGNIDVGAAEIRIALTDRLGFIASKDGYADLHFKSGLRDESGFANISLGLKYAVFSDPASDTILTVGAEYEPPTGNLRTTGISLQGRGDGFVDLFVTGAKAFGPLGFQASIGTNLALDGAHDSSMLHWSLHADYEILPGIWPLVEMNGFSVIDKGSRNAAFNFEGTDLVNFGAGRAGTVMTAALGVRARLFENVLLGFGYEKSISDREDLFNWRVYGDLVIRY